MRNRKYDVFISYSSKDNEIVDRICQLMRQKQIFYFRYTQEIQGGEAIFSELAKAILNSVVFLYIGSDNSYSSIYTPKEINFAISKNTNIIIPYLVDNSPLPDNLLLAFSDLNVRNIGEHSPEVIIEDIIKAVPRLRTIVNTTVKKENIDNIVFSPYYADALEYYNLAEKLYYDDRFERFPQMRMAALAYAKYAELLGYTNRGKWLYNEIWRDDKEVQKLYEDKFEKDEITKGVRLKLAEAEANSNDIVKKIKSGIPIVNIKFSDELNDAETKWNVFVTDSVNYTDIVTGAKVIKIKESLIKMVLVKRDSFIMGASLQEGGENKDEQILHEVTLDSFYICETPVTQDLWNTIMEYNPCKIKNKKFPVTNVSWEDCQSFIKKLNDITDLKFRLPSEAEWEFSAKGGMKGKLNGYKYSGSNTITDIMWY